MPENIRLPAFGQWVTAYFDHGDLSTHDLDQLSWVLSSQSHVPTVYNIPVQQWNTMVRLGDDAATDLPFLGTFQNQLSRTYQKAFFDTSIAGIFPNMKRSYLVGDKTAAFAFAGLWAVQNDVKTLGGVIPINFKMLEGTNHFVRTVTFLAPFTSDVCTQAHWDVPEKALATFAELF